MKPYYALLALLLMSCCQLYSQNEDFASSSSGISPPANSQPKLGGIDVFDEVETFEPGSFNLALGMSLISDLDLGESEGLLTNQLPAIHLFFEKCIVKNIGIGLKLGTRWWTTDKLNYNYRYYSIGLRGTYHVNVHEKIDPYLGLAFAGRGLWIGNGERNVNEKSFDLGLVLGGRYFLTDGLAVFAEYAEDGLGKVHLGITLKLK